MYNNYYKAKQTEYIVLHQPLSRFACKCAAIIHLLANLYTLGKSISMATKSGHIIAWKAIMTVEAADFRGSGH